ncbi:MAG: hypothetical protein ACRC68_01785 [Clostridium sp.]
MENNLTVLQNTKMELEVRELSLNLYWREAALYSKSEIVPATFKGKPENCYIAIDMARNMKMPPLTIMQNMYIVHGNPSFKTSFMVSRFNTQGRFAPLRYEFTGTPGTNSYGCRAYATEIDTGEIIKGSEITIQMANLEGWSAKAGSKWKTMPEQMLQYRASAFFIRVHCPEILNGMQTVEEVEDFTIIDEVLEKKEIKEANKIDIDIDKDKDKDVITEKIKEKVKKDKKEKEEVNIEDLNSDDVGF